MRVAGMTDPWLPNRLNARLGVSTAEEAIREQVWSELAGWLTLTARRVLRGALPPDLDAIWARANAWADAVEAVLSGRILDALRSSYEAILGRDYPWRSRPFVARYLSEVRNRLSRIPDEVYDLAAQELAEGVGLGEGITALAARIDKLLSNTGSERWPNRARVIARTEAIGALNGARMDAFRAIEEDVDEGLEKVWLATDDRRTRPSHREADQQRQPVNGTFTVGGSSLEFPGDPSGPPQEVIQCRCTMLLMAPGEYVDLSNRQFRNGRRGR